MFLLTSELHTNQLAIIQAAETAYIAHNVRSGDSIV